MQIFDNIYFLIIFTVPAAIHILYHTYIRLNTRQQQDKSVEIAESVAFCAAVLFINILLMQTDIKNFVQYLSSKRTIEFDYPMFMAKYCIMTISVSVAVIIVWYLFGIKIFRKVVNLVNKMLGRPLEVEQSDTFNAIFNSTDIIDTMNKAVAVYKGTNLVTAGLIAAYDPPQNQGKKLALKNSDYVKELLQDDQKRPVEYRVFQCSELEYYDPQTDTLIKFYDLDKYDKL